MNFTKKSLAILMALAIVFTTLVCMSVSASMDLTVPNSPVTYSGGSLENCKSSTPGYLSDGKITFANSENLNDTDSARINCTETGLDTLLADATTQGKDICIDLYSEFTSTNSQTNANLRMNFGAGYIKTATSTNVQEASANSIANFVSGSVVTIKLPVSAFTPGTDSSVSDLGSSIFKVTAMDGDTITGSFWISVPYIEGTSGSGTVAVTSFKTTTTKAASKTDGNVDIFSDDDQCRYTGNNSAAYSNSKFLLGDLNGTNKGKYFYCYPANTEGGNQQIQVQAKLDNFSTIYQKAVTDGKDICIDIYANDFSDGSSANTHYCDLKLKFNGSNWTGDKDCQITSGYKKTMVLTTSMVTAEATQIDFTFQNYSWGSGTIKDAEFTVSAPYIEGATATTYKEETTPTKTAKPSTDYDGSTIGVYNSGVEYTATSSDRCYSQLGSDTTYGSRYDHIYGNGKVEYGGAQLTGKVTLTGLSDLVAKAKEEDRRICIDIYANDFLNSSSKGTSYCYFRTSFQGCKSTGDATRLVTSGKCQTLAISTEMDPADEKYFISESSTYFNYGFINYSYGSHYINNANFVISVPYLEGDEPTSTISITNPEVPTTPSPSYTPGGEAIPMNVPTTAAQFTGGWTSNTDDGNPTLSNDNKIASCIASTPKNQIQMSCNASGIADVVNEAITTGKDVCVDVYGEYLRSNQTAANSAAAAQISFGGSFVTPTAESKGNLMPSTVHTYKYSVESLLNSVTPSTTTTTAVVPGEYEAEKLSKTQSENVTYENYSQTDISPKATIEMVKHLALGGFVEYTIPNVDAGEYNLTVSSRDTKIRGKFKAYVNGVECSDIIDFTNESTVEIEHSLGTVNLETAGDITVKFVYETAIPTTTDTNPTYMGLDKFNITRTDGQPITLAPTTTPTTTTLSQDELIAKLNKAWIQIQGTTWGYTYFGHFYMSAPYVDGATGSSGLTGVITTTTKPTASQYGVTAGSSGWGDPDKLVWQDTDVKISAGWEANNTKNESSDTRKYAIMSVKNASAQIGGWLNVSGIQDLVEYAKTCDGKIGIDIYPTFTHNDNASPYCYMKMQWQGGAATSDKANMLTSNKKYTFMTYAEDIPANAEGLTMYFQNYSYGNPATLLTGTFYISAPYLYGYDSSLTTTKITTKATTSTTARSYTYPSSNSGTTKFAIGTAESLPGGSVQVPITLSGNEGLASATFQVKYDYDNLTYSSYIAGNVFQNVSGNDNEGVLNFVLERGTNATKNGVVLYLLFDVTDELGSYVLDFANSNGYGYKAGAFFNDNADNVSCSFTSGAVKVVENLSASTTSQNKVNVAQVKLKTLTLTKANKVKLTWNKATNAKSYVVYRKIASGKYTKVKTTTTTSYVGTQSYSKNYSYLVKGLNGSTFGKASAAKSITAMNPKAKAVIKSLSKAKKKSTLKIKAKVAGAKGYLVQYSTSKKFKSAKKTVTTSLNKTLTKLKSGKKYYVRVKSYNIVNGKKAYSKKWSSVKTVVVK